MDRRQFLTISSLGFAGLMLPTYGRVIAAEALLSPLDVAMKKSLADTALQAATSAGASYCDARIGRYLRQFVITREDKVQNVVNTESTGIGIRVIADGAWGFAATNDLSTQSIANAAKQATAIAKANAKTQTAPVQLAKTAGVGEVAWKTPIVKNSMEVPIKDKVDLLLGVNADAVKAGADFVNSILFLVNEQKYFASTDGSYIDQDVHRIWAPMTITAIDKASGKFRTRDGLSAPMGMGFEYLDGSASGKVVSPNGVVNYGKSYDMREDAIAAAKQAREKLKAPSVKPGKYDLVLDPSHTLAHDPRIDRPSDGARPRAGLRGQLRRHQLRPARQGQGSASSTAATRSTSSPTRRSRQRSARSATTTKASRPGVGPHQERHAGQLPGHARAGARRSARTPRTAARTPTRGRACSSSACPTSRCCRARPSSAPEEMIADAENGIAIVGDGSFSIDQQRYNAQFGGQLFYEIKGGKIDGMLKDVAYQIRTPEFWNSCVGGLRRERLPLGGSFFDGKGQPSQVDAVSHGSGPARFNGVNVINTARNLG